MFDRTTDYYILLKQHKETSYINISSSVHFCICYCVVPQTVVSDTGCILSGIQAKIRAKVRLKWVGHFLSWLTQKGESNFKIIQSHSPFNNWENLNSTNVVFYILPSIFSII